VRRRPHPSRVLINHPKAIIEDEPIEVLYILGEVLVPPVRLANRSRIILGKDGATLPQDWLERHLVCLE
jgi:hypothetical protein